MRLASCRDYHSCDSSCLQDQREWCLMQESFMDEPNEKKRDDLIWEFIISLQPLMKNLARKLSRNKGRNVEADDLAGHMSLLLFRRFKRECDTGAFYKRIKLKGYLRACLTGELVRLRQINGQDLSLDELLEKEHKNN